MPPSLIKLFIGAASTVTGTVDTVTTTAVSDAVARFNASVTLGMIDAGNTTTTIPDTSFVDDAGNPVTASGLLLPSSGGYINVYVNGLLQESSLSTWTATSLVLATASILVGTPVVVEVHNYSGTSSTSTSTPNLTVSTTINT